MFYELVHEIKDFPFLVFCGHANQSTAAYRAYRQ